MATLREVVGVMIDLLTRIQSVNIRVFNTILIIVFLCFNLYSCHQDVKITSRLRQRLKLINKTVLWSCSETCLCPSDLDEDLAGGFKLLVSYFSL